jgi:chemotaxis protein MotB
MPSLSNEQKRILIKKIIQDEPVSHGGAWKIAFADLMTALMAFFMVLWIVASSSTEQKKMIAEYFKDPDSILVGKEEAIVSNNQKNGASNSVIDMGGSLDAVSEDKKQLEEMLLELDKKETALNQKEFKDEMESIKTLIETEFKDIQQQLNLTISKEGLLIELTDDRKKPMFASGSDEPSVYAKNFYKKLTKMIITFNKPISILGHTDAKKFKDGYYDNFRLSSDRANSVKDIFIENGFDENKIYKVEGLGSRDLLNKKNPLDAKNRRIGVLVINDKIKKNSE